MTDPARPVRVLNFISRMTVASPAIYATLLTEHFGPPGYESALVCGLARLHEGDLMYYAEQRGIRPIVIAELGLPPNPARDLLTLWKVYRCIRDFQPDIVHTHTTKAGFIARLAARLAGVPVVVHTFHSHVFQGYFNPVLTAFFIRLERRAAQMSDTLITLTESLRRELAEDYRIARKKHITVLPLGMDLDRFARTPRHAGAFRAHWNIPPDAPLVGIVGRLAAVKNHSLFLEAAARVRAELPDARFVVVGDGETRAQTEAHAAHIGLRDAVIFTGWLRDLPPVYADLDALVISSLTEGTPAPVIEALAAGCPVVATGVGGLPDLLDRGRLGRLVAPGDPDALAAGILDVLRQPPSVAEAQRLMFDRYSIHRLVHDLDGLYRGLLAKKRRAKPSRS